MVGKNRSSWGAGRVAFLARLDAIRAKLMQGATLATVYAEYRGALGVGYSGFVKLVDRYVGDRPTRRRSKQRPAAPSPPTTTKQEGPLSYARHESRPVFKYDGNPREDDEERLIGPRKRN